VFVLVEFEIVAGIAVEVDIVVADNTVDIAVDTPVAMPIQLEEELDMHCYKHYYFDNSIAALNMLLVACRNIVQPLG
jgi:hypothetical protein